jgi:type I restriction enzyme S subunit
MELTNEKYLDHKNSGIKWVDKIPLHWQSKPFYTIGKVISEINCQDNELLSVYLDRGVIKFSDVTEKRTNVTSEDLSKYQAVKPGNLVLNNQQAWRGSVGVSKYYGIVSPAYIVLSLSKDFDHDFANYLFRDSTMVSHYLVCSKGVGTIQRNLYWPQLKRVNVMIPPLHEQTAIAEFLDHKTAKIDQAIDIKQKQIELLTERRQILINRAVTRGLDPNVKMKDSGVKWIGEIPEHWELNRFRNIFNLSKGLTITKENLTDSGVFCINYGEIHSKFGFEVNPEINELKCVHEDYLKSDKNSLLKKGDFLFADTSEDISGSGNFTYLNSEIPTFAGYHTVIARPKFEINSRFFAYLFDSLCFRNQIRVRVKGVKVFSITQSILKDPFIWLPSSDEQNNIVSFLDNQVKLISNAVELKKSEIEKLKEYKATLINSAVTGKIKVHIDAE